MRKLLDKKQILTIPNLLSLARLLLIPRIVRLYRDGNGYGAFAVIVLSGLTDLVDGFVARRFNMTSEVGKILDPAADKLTQAVLFICLASSHKLLWVLFIIFAIKEIAMMVIGAIDIKKTDSVTGAKWHGKLNTALVYATLMLLMIMPDMSPSLADAILIFDALVMVVSFMMYVRYYRKHINENKK